MPGIDQTGPAGMGPMTGRGRGVCSTGRAIDGTGVPRNMGFGQGMGCGRGYRRGFGAQMNAYPTQGMGGRGRRPYFQAYPEDGQMELSRLKNEAATMSNALEEINERINELEKKA